MIRQLRDEYEFLDNFWPAPIEMDNKIWPTVEHYFQVRKCELPTEAEMIRKQPTPEMAKRAGQQVQLRKGWDRMKKQVMLEAVRAKFQQHPGLATKLLDTGTEKIQEGNRWGDSFWGVDLRTGRGKNHLGLIIMQVRGELGEQSRKNNE